MANGNGQSNRRKDVGMKLIYAVLSILISAFVAITLGVANSANDRSQTNTKDIAVMEKDVEKNQELIIQKIDSMSAQQHLYFERMDKDIENVDKDIGDVKNDIKRYHSQ